MKRFAWLNLTTGEFSNSWTEKDMAYKEEYLQDLIKEANKPSDDLSVWKLIQYECLNDTDFEFFNCMRLK